MSVLVVDTPILEMTLLIVACIKHDVLHVNFFSYITFHYIFILITL